MGLKKDYPSEDPASTPTGEQDPATGKHDQDPPARWLPLEDSPLGPEGSQFFGCALRVWDPDRADLPEGATFWSCIAYSGRTYSGREPNRTEARIAAESKAAEINADRIGKQIAAADEYSRDHDLCIHCRSDLDDDGICTGCGMGQEIDGSTAPDSLHTSGTNEPAPVVWVIALEIDPDLVIDGFDPSELERREGADFLLSQMGKIVDHWRPEQARARVILAPDPALIRRMQGYES